MGPERPRQAEAPTGIRTNESTLLGSALEAVQGLNERCLLLLRLLAQGAEGPAPQAPPFLMTLASRFRRLDPATIPDAARQTFLLVDFAFRRPTVWNEVLAGHCPPLRFPPILGQTYSGTLVSLARGTVLLAHNVCRHHPAHAGLLLGLDPGVATGIATLRLHDLERFAETHPEYLRFRWEDRPAVWRRLLQAASSHDPALRAQFHLYGMQLMAGDLASAFRPTC